jgi:hypoxanthine-DNA glycosylase
MLCLPFDVSGIQGISCWIKYIQRMAKTEQLIESHPFEAFVPRGIEYLIVGSFPGREHTQSPVPEGQWFYGARRNQFWKILEGVYGRELKHRTEKEALFTELRMGITDIIRRAVRLENSNLDQNLDIIEYNDDRIAAILKQKTLKKVFFTSRFVEKVFKLAFPDYPNTEVLPSPSPRYATLSMAQKVAIYKEKLPNLKTQDSKLKT